MLPFNEIDQRAVGRWALEKANRAAADPLHHWNSPIWFRGIDVSIPIPVFAAMVAHAVAQLTKEQIAAEEWRAKQEFVAV